MYGCGCKVVWDVWTLVVCGWIVGMRVVSMKREGGRSEGEGVVLDEEKKRGWVGLKGGRCQMKRGAKGSQSKRGGASDEEKKGIR